MKKKKAHFVLLDPLLSKVLERTRVCHDRNQSQPMRQDLVVNYGGVHEHVHVFNRHCRHLSKRFHFVECEFVCSTQGESNMVCATNRAILDRGIKERYPGWWWET